MARRTKDALVAAIMKNIDVTYNNMLSGWMKDLHKQISSLDLNDEHTLQIAISGILKCREIEQNTIAEALGQSRVQIGRWAKGAHIPRNASYRAFLVKELLRFIRGKAGEMEKAS